jgi:hypothetical protein
MGTSIKREKDGDIHQKRWEEMRTSINWAKRSPEMSRDEDSQQPPPER